MTLFCFDTETFKIEQDIPVPKLVCVTTYDSSDHSNSIYHAKYDGQEVHDLLSYQLQHADTIIGANLPFDFLVIAKAFPDLLPLIWARYDRNLDNVGAKCANPSVQDVQIIEAHNLLRTGRYWDWSYVSLASLAKKYLNTELDKSSDTYRLRYGELYNTPLENWPKEAINYALLDAEVTYKVYETMPKTGQWVAQHRAHWALHVSSRNPLYVDLERLSKLEAKVEKEIQDSMQLKIFHNLVHYTKKGIIKRNSKGDIQTNLKAVRALVTEAYNGEPPLTDKEQVATDSETLLNSGNPTLEALGRVCSFAKIRSSYLPFMRLGKITTNYRPLLETGRCSSYKPNIQQFPRSLKVRECITARPDHYLISCDYDSLEMRTLAQVLLWLFGESKLAEVFQRNYDPHLFVVSCMLNEPYETTLAKKKDPHVKHLRQLSKIANFGYAGGAGAKTFQTYAKGFGVTLTEQKAKELKQKWLRAYPEMYQYFKRASNNMFIKEPDRSYGQLTTHISERFVNRVRYGSWCNYQFQGLAADGAKNAMYHVVKETFNGRLVGAKVVGFLHDEILLESPCEKTSEQAKVLKEIMVEKMKEYTPDIPITCSPAIMKWWDKNAESEVDENGDYCVYPDKGYDI